VQAALMFVPCFSKNHL